jgi:Rab3 GTPase-activating protein regulatory subunit N-terminus
VSPICFLQVCLVIYAPRKGVCDVYATRHGPVLHSLQCGANCRYGKQG